MRHFNKFLTLALVLAASAQTMTSANFGYCTDKVSRDNIFRVGTTEKQGMAIRLSHEKVQMLKGCTISGVSAAFGSKRTNDENAHLFVSTDLYGEALVAQASKITDAAKWVTFTFDDKYTITGDEEELYIGYTAEINNKSTMLMADYNDVSPNCSFVLVDGRWTDTQTVGCGNVTLRVNIADAPPVTDLMIKSVSMSSFFNANTEYDLRGQVFNFGNETITSFDLDVLVGGDSEVYATQHYGDIQVAQGQNFDIEIPAFASSQEGETSLEIRIKNVNGTDDADTSDNVFVTDIFCYPQDMERGILLEGFTGQYCSNCPAGHATLESFLGRIDTPVVEVMHHSGYSPDLMTMDADLDYTFFYGSPSTFAPAVMLNRLTVPTIGVCPVMHVTADNLDACYNALMHQQPYASLGLQTSFDPVTREVNVALHTYTHNDLPTEQGIINVMLVQDKIVSYQTPYGENYTHNAVFRGVLTGNSWGVMLPQEAYKAGGTADWSTSFVLPEGIFADYYKNTELSENQRKAYTIDAVPENMRIVAFIGAYADNDVNGHVVYNAVSVPLGESYTQKGMASNPIVMPDKNVAVDVSVANRRIVINGEYDQAQIYTVDGMSVPVDSSLNPGLYIVRVKAGNAETAVKMLIK